MYTKILNIKIHWQIILNKFNGQYQQYLRIVARKRSSIIDNFKREKNKGKETLVQAIYNFDIHEYRWDTISL